MANHLQFARRSPLSIATSTLRPWSATAAFWGAGAGTAVLFLLSVTPLVKREFLTKIPIMGTHYEDKVPASDKPF
ncbi:hypothetical protein CYLTODRAFT_455667 [Cylindrobasidium torrendii FP15055 ss-10]|uniref:Uncharacterized protein n=1 Tax=Cylindrobasidium torrendii FP15055 ss-10 TaxID=1314674 RepID=A0A0D7B7E4_9AGAR|nr:hypothetical protein CYLTODRAFT_455667 [Cylindrobasidium torrendii FP15055 ss-10]